MAAILMISACFLLQLWPLSTATCSTRKECQSKFYNAAFEGDLDYVETALCSTINLIDPNGPNDKGFTPLIIAAKLGHKSVVQALVNHGAELELTENSIRATALYQAAKFNQAAVARVLLRAGANGNVRIKDAYTPLMVAAQKGHVGVVQALVEKPVNLELRSNDSDGLTALYLAAVNNKVGVTRSLLREGAKVNVRTNDGSTPLMSATLHGYYRVVNVLLKADDINVNLAKTCGQEWTALHYAAWYNNQTAIATLLLKKGADNTILTADGFIPSALAEQRGKLDLKRIIEDYNSK